MLLPSQETGGSRWLPWEILTLGPEASYTPTCLAQPPAASASLSVPTSDLLGPGTISLSLPSWTLTAPAFTSMD